MVRKLEIVTKSQIVYQPHPRLSPSLDKVGEILYSKAREGAKN